MKKYLTFFIFLIFSLSFAFSISVDELLPSMDKSYIDCLKSGKIINVITTTESSSCGISTIEDMGTVVDFERNSKESVITIAPEGSKGKLIAEQSADLQKGFCVGFLALLPYPESMQNMNESEKQIFVFDKITNISTQAEIKYNSFTAGNKIRTLFQDAYLISNPHNILTKIDDPVFNYVPDAYTCYSYQKDNRFGKNTYKIDFQNTSNEIFMDICNLTTMKFFLIPCVQKETLHMYLDVINTNDGILLFAMAKIENQDTEVHILNYTVDLPTSFLRRITALGKWFTNNIYEVSE